MLHWWYKASGQREIKSEGVSPAKRIPENGRSLWRSNDCTCSSGVLSMRSFKPGDEVTVTVEPVKNGNPAGRVLQVVLPTRHGLFAHGSRALRARSTKRSYAAHGLWRPRELLALRQRDAAWPAAAFLKGTLSGRAISRARLLS